MKSKELNCFAKGCKLIALCKIRYFLKQECFFFLGIKILLIRFLKHVLQENCATIKRWWAVWKFRITFAPKQILWVLFHIFWCKKPTKRHVRPAKTQISLGICPVWSESLLCAQWVVQDPSFLHADSKDSDQTGQMLRLIWVFAGCTCYISGFVMRWLKYLLNTPCIWIYSRVSPDIQCTGTPENQNIQGIPGFSSFRTCLKIAFHMVWPV